MLTGITSGAIAGWCGITATITGTTGNSRRAIRLSKGRSLNGCARFG
jgi:hypothetical protein